MVSHTGIEPVTPWLKVKCSTDWANGSYFGAGDEGRTRDIQLGRLTLYQLSYSRIIWFVVPRAGLEPARDKFPQDFKSCASTDFATKAFISICCCFLTHKYSISISQLIFIVNTFFKIFLIFSFGYIRSSNIMLKYIIKTKIFHFFLLIFVTKECLLVRNNLTNIL